MFNLALLQSQNPTLNLSADFASDFALAADARTMKKILCSKSRTAGTGSLTLDISNKVHSHIFQQLYIK